MHLTRYGFNILAVIYLLPLVLIDVVGNTLSEGAASDYFYFKAMFDGCLIAYAIYQLTRPATTSVAAAQAKAADRNDDVVSFEHLGAIEYVYCLLLSAYAAGNWYWLHGLNKTSTGLMSMGTLIWSFVSIGICILAAIQFYHLKSGAIVELKKRVIQ